MPDFNTTALAYRLLVRLEGLNAAGEPVGEPVLLALGADAHVPRGDYAGTYEGKILGDCTLDFDQGDGPFPEIIYSEFRFAAARDEAGGSVDALLAWVRARQDRRLRVRAFCAAPGECAAADEVFAGFVKLEAVAYGADRLDFSCYDVLEAWGDRELPLYSFGVRDAAYLELMDESLRDKPVPLLYGYWDSPGDRYRIPAWFVKTREGEKKIVHVCDSVRADGADPGIGALLGPVKWTDGAGQPRGGGMFDGARLDHTRLVLDHTADVAWGENDAALLQGAVGCLADDGEPLVSPPLIVYDLLLRAGFPAASLDALSFAATHAVVRDDFSFRAYLDESRPVLDLVAEVCRDAGLRLFVRAGLVRCAVNYLYHFEEEAPAAQTLAAREVLTGRTEHQLNPAAWEYDAVRLKYDYHPAKGVFLKELSLSGPDVDAADPGARILEIESRWLYREADARALANRLRLTALAQVRTISVAAPHRGLAFFPADRLAWDGDGLQATYHVSRVTRDYEGGTGEVRAVAADDGNTYFGGALTVGNDPDFAGSTEQQRRDHAFVTPDDGLLDPAQPTVHYSIIT